METMVVGFKAWNSQWITKKPTDLAEFNFKTDNS